MPTERLKRPVRIAQRNYEHSTWGTRRITTHNRHNVWKTRECQLLVFRSWRSCAMGIPLLVSLSPTRGLRLNQKVKLWTLLLPNSTSWSSVKISIMFGFLSLGISIAWTGIGCFFIFPPRRCVWNSVAAFDPALWGANTSSTEVGSSGRCWCRTCGERFEEPTPTAISQNRMAANNGVTSRAMLVGLSLSQRTDVSGIAVGSLATWKCNEKHY